MSYVFNVLTHVCYVQFHWPTLRQWRGLSNADWSHPRTVADQTGAKGRGWEAHGCGVDRLRCAHAGNAKVQTLPPVPALLRFASARKVYGVFVRWSEDSLHRKQVQIVWFVWFVCHCTAIWMTVVVICRHSKRPNANAESSCLSSSHIIIHKS